MRILSFFLYSLSFSLCAILGMLFFLAHYPTIDLEKQNILLHARPTRILDDENNEWARFQLDRREPASFNKIPEILIHAFLAAEDRNFFHHHGISWRGIIRAAWTNLTQRRFAQGASTITHQLVKLIFLSQEKTITRKIKEQITALIIEYQCTKEQILEAYLNIIYCGNGIYGVQTAAQRFWNIQDLKQLSLSQCALLAGLVKSPASYCPLNPKNHDVCLARRNLVLKLMVQQNYCSQSEYEAALKEPLTIVIEKTDSTCAAYARELVRQTAENLIGREQLYAGGLTIKTTFNMKIQKNAETTFNKHMNEFKTKKPSIPLNGALVTLEPTGALKALIGGSDFENSQFDRARQARRQIGSLIKPFVYGAGLMKGLHLWDVLIDEPITTIPHWNPRNFNRRFEGPMTRARALAISNNIIAIKTFLEVGAQEVINFIQKCHIPGPFIQYPSLALGCIECSLLEITAAYMLFVNNGIYEEPYCIEWIKDRWGKKIWRHRPYKEVVLPSTICGQIIQALKLVPAHLATRLKSDWLKTEQVESIGKTGTTNNVRSSWFVGATPSYITGVYLGCDDNRLLLGSVSATRTAVPLWLEFNKTLEHHQKTFYLDPALRPVIINARTGETTDSTHSQAITLMQ